MTGDPTQPEPWPRPAGSAARPEPFPQPGFGVPVPQPGAVPPFPQPGFAQPAFPDPAAGPPPVPQYYGPPGSYPMPPVPPARKNRGALIAGLVVAALVVVAGLGAAGSVVLLSSPDSIAAPRATTEPFARGDPDAEPRVESGPAASEPAENGPFASEYPAEEIFDLNRVCDEDVFYPQSPKRSGKAPHPVVLLVNDGDSGVRYQNSSYFSSQGYSKSVSNTWAPDNPKKVQLAACLDRVKTGTKLRSCKYDDPKKLTVTLHSAGWRLRVVEVATGRELVDKAMKGDDRACPYFVMVGKDRKIYAKASDRSVVNALKAVVKK